jgi:hypothetical protein
MLKFSDFSLEQLAQQARKEKTDCLQAEARLGAVIDEVISRLQPLSSWRTEGCRVTWVVRGPRRTLDPELLASNLRALGLTESQVETVISDSYTTEVGKSHWATYIDPL